MELPSEKQTMAQRLTVQSGISSPQNLEPFSLGMERRVLRKCDIYVMPFLGILYMFAFLDRVNIGNVRTTSS